MYESANILIVTAMMAEARPLIDHYGLKQDTTSHQLPVFGNDHIRLTISQPGKAQSAVAATYLLSTAASLDRLVALNIGVAAFAGDTEVEAVACGDLFVVHRVMDHSADKWYFPDILVETGARQLGISTFDYGVTQTNCPDDVTQLVDMEASGFCQAASTFLPPHRVGIVKIVSDFLAFDQLTQQLIEGLIATRVPQIIPIIDAYESLGIAKSDVLTEEDQGALSGVGAALRLTVTQREQLQQWARTGKLENGGELPDVSRFAGLDVSTKADGKKYFAELRQHLLGR